MLEYLKLMPTWAIVLFALGVIAGAVTLAFLLAAFQQWLEEQVRRLIYIYRYKHRFGKPPTAKCYCKDCENWYPHSPQATEGRCWRFENRTMADNWFCWDAEPRETERK